MENKKENNFAYIDGANLHRGTTSLGWKLDYKRFRVWLAEKYEIKTAYLFLGLVPKYKELYKYLQECGFILTYKQVSYDDVGTVKGNCDAILVLDAVSGFYEKKYDKAVIVSSDGDYAELVEFLKNKKALLSVVSPSNKCSYLLRRQNTPLLYLDTQRRKLEGK
ncbi:MAG: hypothetical protein A2402_00835 [Candidatus Staskawiczbacteria bacterium RIFOXYC1_FULL_37_43]|nr:MAG: hypothetical protein A2813_00665 [Candidatus Staskawiczbacteria bacterium RIFCSPHIGHO2_01_FULL_37_17]OGZ71439.1 MAG: hypothetical protein A2891_00825 [Candidatus Staskawiczbacteria bacterium RIFCSPLOWO2_01_FULL_37_19]OGZ76166.1 MAG: hypothetical protein A2205_03910 [Candidatus Staskawiczbacteria bacterium RIFOXYA1_FULL_37_15]OGZ77032.1 MAG: hypothetical protein A2280_00910 [Candidatus Staskawiczbacteria bacterium RIFOXYA12_FULL_37_10]OGZ80135.1 MAG: hypothetical protein A2353_02625 [Can